VESTLLKFTTDADNEAIFDVSLSPFLMESAAITFSLCLKAVLFN